VRLTAKQTLHRPGTLAALGLRAAGARRLHSTADRNHEETRTMSFNSWIGFLRSAFTGVPMHRRSRRPRSARSLRIEGLEDRAVLSFLAPVNYSGGGSLAGDFNNDGRLDLAGVRNGAISVLVGNTNGAFQAAVASAVFSGTLDDLGDFNADGRLDLVGTTTNGVSLLLGNGNGTFQAARSTTIAGKALNAAAGDFNGDGRLDVGATSYTLATGTCNFPRCIPRPIYTGFAHVLLGRGDGSFSSPAARQLGNSAPTPALLADSLRLDDFNEDGRHDLAVAAGNKVYLMLGNGNGALPAPSSVANGSGNLETFTAADINGDSHLDLVTGNWSLPTDVRVYLGRGDGAFDSPVVTSLEGRLPAALATGDFNDDGQLDVVAASNTICATDVGINCSTSSDNVRLTVLLGQGDGGFTMHDGGFSIPAGLPIAAVSVAAGSFNGDTFPDVAFRYSDTISVLLNDGVWATVPSVRVSISDAPQVTEGDGGSVYAQFTVSLSEATSQTVTVTYQTVSLSALAGADYTAVSGMLTFTPGAPTSQTILVPVKGDLTDEYDEAFEVRLTGAVNASINDGQSRGFIIDNDPPPTILIDDASITEGNSGSKTLVFRVRLSAASEKPVSVFYATTNGTAKTGNNDYVAASGLITFDQGQTEATISVVIKGDRSKENDETFFVNLSNALDAILGDSQGKGTILNDD
jgi:hypothetical protein